MTKKCFLCFILTITYATLSKLAESFVQRRSAPFCFDFCNEIHWTLFIPPATTNVFLVHVIVFNIFSERIHISTPNKYEYQFVKKPSNMEFLTFMCKAKNDATIGLARGHDAHELYEIVLGGWDNTISWIARSRMGKFIKFMYSDDNLTSHNMT